MRAWFVLSLLVTLAGCSGEAPAPAPAVDGPTIVTSPLNLTDGRGAHIHDYWRGGERVTVVDATHPGGDAKGTGPGFASGQDVEVRSFQPDSGNVVPQGTSAVEVTFTWTDAELDAYTTPALYLKTAGTNATERVADVVNGESLTIEVGAPDADLPHQLLSAWLFELRMSSPEPMPLRFKGSVDLKVDAIRGLELPVFPGHPDPWQGARELPLLSGSGQVSYFEDLGDQGCNGLSCPTVFRPESGRIVPANATLVRIIVTTGANQAPALQLHFHSALERDFAPATPITSAGGVLTYELAPDGGGDGPYATQSQWEFTVLPATTGPVRTAWMADYTLEAVVIR